MYLTIAELAKAVDKDQGYIRQHVFRGHLVARRRGNRLCIDLHDAARWAHNRGLEFDAPIELPTSSRSSAKRSARLTVLTTLDPTNRTRNLFSLLRHRQEDALGPWARPHNKQWSNKELSNGLRLLSFDGPLESVLGFVEQINNDGALQVGDIEIHYDLHPAAQRYTAYRDDRRLANDSIRSPFSRHSANITEYWSFDKKLREFFVKLQETSIDNLRSDLQNLGFPLDERIDRIGNLMIAGAEDTITCSLDHGPNQSLRFSVAAKDLPRDAYRAIVWASFCGCEIIRREFSVSGKETTLILPSTVDHIGFSVQRTADGKCVDWMETNLIMEVHGNLEIDSGLTLRIQDRKRKFNHNITPRRETASWRVSADEEASDLDRRIRQHLLDCRLVQREKQARVDGNLVRFQPHQFPKAVSHIVRLVRNHSSDGNETLYLGDPYFDIYLDLNKQRSMDLAKAYLDLFAATIGSSLQILCACACDPNERPWWTHYPAQLWNHVSVRSFMKHGTQLFNKSRRAFHDRYVINSASEYLMTNSFNGWQTHGVTFVRLPFGVYRAEAERLWSMSLQSNTEPLYVQEIS